MITKKESRMDDYDEGYSHGYTDGYKKAELDCAEEVKKIGEDEMKFIKLHNDDGFEYHINPNQICVMHPITVANPEDGTALFLSASEDSVEVAETIEEIVRLICEVEHGEDD